jgi:hypothetical protein
MTHLFPGFFFSFFFHWSFNAMSCYFHSPSYVIKFVVSKGRPYVASPTHCTFHRHCKFCALSAREKKKLNNPCLGYDVSSSPCTTCFPPFLFTLELAHVVSTHHCVYSLITSIWRICGFAPERSGFEFFFFFSFSLFFLFFSLHEYHRNGICSSIIELFFFLFSILDSFDWGGFLLENTLRTTSKMI